MDRTFNPPAHPQPAESDKTHIRNKWEEGMSLRDWFAGMALQGIITFEFAAGVYAKPEALTVDAERAYQYADAMLNARQPKRPETIDDL